MGQEYSNENRWSLFRNERKSEDKDPDYTGSLNVDGVEFYLNGWLKESKKDGKKFFSGNIKKKERRP